MTPTAVLVIQALLESFARLYNIDDCLGVSCSTSGSGECLDGINGFTCECFTGYSGPLCGTGIYISLSLSQVACTKQSLRNKDRCLTTINQDTSPHVVPHACVHNRCSGDSKLGAHIMLDRPS